MDKHVLHNVIHRDSNNSSKDCPVCNGSINLEDKPAMRGKVNEILDRKQQMGMDYSEEEKELVEFAELTFKSKKKVDDTKNTVKAKADAEKPGDNDTNDKDNDPEDKAELKNSEPELRSFIDVFSFSEDKKSLPTRIKVLNLGEVDSPRYGKVKITQDVIDQMIKNFDESVRAHSKNIGLPIRVEHGETKLVDAAAGWMKKLFSEKDGMYATVEWTPIGKQALENKIYKCVSPGFWLNGYKDPETSKEIKNVMTEVSLVNFPGMPHSLPPLVYSEQNKIAPLTQESQSSTVFIEITNLLPKSNMNLKEIVAKEKTQRTSEEQAFLATHKEELTYKEYISEFPQEITAKESKNTVKEGEVVMAEKEVAELRTFRERMVRQDSIETVKKLVFAEKGIKVPADQVEKLADVRLTLSGDALKNFDETLSSLPVKEIFEEKGKDNALNMSEKPGEQLASLAKAKQAEAKKNGGEMSYAEAENAVMVEKPELYNLAFPRN